MHPNQTNHIPSNGSPGFSKYLNRITMLNLCHLLNFLKMHTENVPLLLWRSQLLSCLLWLPPFSDTRLQEVFIFVSVIFLRRWRTVLRGENTLLRRRHLTYCDFVRWIFFLNHMAYRGLTHENLNSYKHFSGNVSTVSLN